MKGCYQGLFSPLSPTGYIKCNDYIIMFHKFNNSENISEKIMQE